MAPPYCFSYRFYWLKLTAGAKKIEAKFWRTGPEVNFDLNILFEFVLGAGVKGWPLWGDSQFQAALMDTPQGMAELHSHDGGASDWIYIRRGRKCQTETGRENKKSEKQETQGQRRRRRRKRYCLAPDQTSTAVRGWPHAIAHDYSQRSCHHGDPILEQRKDVRRREQQRETAACWLWPPGMPCIAQEVESGEKEWSRPWGKEEEKCCFNVCLFVYQYLNQ